MLGISRVVVHKYSSILSAYGIALADVVEEKQEPSSKTYSSETKSHFEERLDALAAEAEEALAVQGIDEASIQTEQFLNMRY